MYTKMLYVGETERQPRDMIREHMADIRLCRKTPVGKHFREECHEVEMLRVAILDRIVECVSILQTDKREGEDRQVKD